MLSSFSPSFPFGKINFDHEEETGSSFFSPPPPLESSGSKRRKQQVIRAVLPCFSSPPFFFRTGPELGAGFLFSLIDTEKDERGQALSPFPFPSFWRQSERRLNEVSAPPPFFPARQITKSATSPLLFLTPRVLRTGCSLSSSHGQSSKNYRNRFRLLHLFHFLLSPPPFPSS